MTDRAEGIAKRTGRRAETRGGRRTGGEKRRREHSQERNIRTIVPSPEATRGTQDPSTRFGNP
jgi:hypothetical protein